jgi:hypothetical protein
MSERKFFDDIDWLAGRMQIRLDRLEREKKYDVGQARQWARRLSDRDGTSYGKALAQAVDYLEAGMFLPLLD